MCCLGRKCFRTVREWFAMFRAGDFNLKVKECAGGPFTT